MTILVRETDEAAVADEFEAIGGDYHVSGVSPMANRARDVLRSKPAAGAEPYLCYILDARSLTVVFI